MGFLIEKQGLSMKKLCFFDEQTWGFDEKSVGFLIKKLGFLMQIGGKKHVFFGAERIGFFWRGSYLAVFQLRGGQCGVLTLRSWLHAGCMKLRAQAQEFGVRTG